MRHVLLYGIQKGTLGLVCGGVTKFPARGSAVTEVSTDEEKTISFLFEVKKRGQSGIGDAERLSISEGVVNRSGVYSTGLVDLRIGAVPSGFRGMARRTRLPRRNRQALVKEQLLTKCLEVFVLQDVT
jgi:hypothetical protein